MRRVTVVLVKISPAHSACPERCDGGACVLRDNFTECSQVVCNNTGVVTAEVPVGTCQSSTFNAMGSTTVECIDGACRNSEFTDSINVTCNGVGNSCGFSRFERSNVACFDDSCSDARFYYSKATCDSYGSCATPLFFTACSCCDGTSCPSDGYPPSCQTNPVGFCETTYLGRNCQEWGNPICVGLNIEPTGTIVTICDYSGDCQGQDFSNTSVYCDNSDATSTCQRTRFSGGEAACDAGACQYSQFTDSTVTCFDSTGEGSCNHAVFNRTRIVCKDTACADIDFHSSALTCEEYSSCETVFSFSCSCCDGYNCPDETLPSCSTDTIEFCKTTYLGRTCKEWGNPVCEEVQIVSTGQEVAICTQGECRQTNFNGVGLLCDNKNNLAAVDTCNAIVVRESMVGCDSGACQKSTFSDSTVDCTDSRGSGSCESSSFRQSRVSCYATSCANAVFTASAVICDSGSCTGSTFDTCSCCDGYGCSGSTTTTEVPSCTTIPVDFCTSCASKGNPICVEMGGVNGTAPSASIPAPASAPSPSDTLTPGPTSVALPPSVTETEGPAASSNAKGDLNPSNDTSVLETPANTPIDIPPRSTTDKGGTVTLIAWPRSGSLNVKGDGTITYTPNPGFVGKDTFEIKRCNVDGQCDSVTITVQVQAAASADESSSSNGLYALSLLVLVPIVICAVLFRKKLGWGKTTTTGGDGSQKGPTSTANAITAEPPRSQAYQPTNKDQVGTVEDQVGGQDEDVVTAADDRVVAAAAAAPTQIAVRQRQDPPSVEAQTEPNRAAAAAAILPHHENDLLLLPDYKDQCRADARGNAPHEPPLANVVFVEEDNVVVDKPDVKLDI